MDAIQNNASFSIVIVRRIYLFQKKKKENRKEKKKNFDPIVIEKRCYRSHSKPFEAD